ncbi:MAG: amidohydrolase family protein [Chloroflexi bacterium]|nr:amidohydrolase family protein [Chloroflexota bacterium]
MIVDVHVHLGYDHTFDESFEKQYLLGKMAECEGIIQIVQPGTCHNLADVRAQHDAIAALCREFPGRFFGMANPSPHLSDDDYRYEVRRCVRELGFVGIKLHPLAHGVQPGSRAARKVWEMANQLEVPLMVHTGGGVPFAAPVALIPMAREFAQVKVVMAHCGHIILAGEAGAAMDACPNIYGDTSWTPGHSLRGWCRAFGPRLMLGTDHADNLPVELAKIRSSGFTPAEQDGLLFKTALEVYRLKAAI